jgi:flagellar basal-body rod protein FlgC
MDLLEISASALSAQRTRMTAIAGNIANANTTRDETGRPVPYRRLEVVFAAGATGQTDQPGVHVQEVRQARDPYRWIFDPNHPDAVHDSASERNGYVLMPRINAVEEMVDMMLASRAYEANLAALEATRTMHSAALRIIG